MPYVRWIPSGLILNSSTPVALSDANATLTISQILNNGAFTISPTVLTTRTLTLPTAANIVAGVSEIATNDCLEFSVINTGAGTAAVAAGTGGALTGLANISANNSGIYRIYVTNIAGGTEAYSIYRLT